MEEECIKPFPRRGDGTLRVSANTKWRVAVWIEDSAKPDLVSKHFDFLNQNLSAETFVSSRDLYFRVADEKFKNSLRSTISRLVREGRIERRDDPHNRNYSLYRLKGTLVRKK